MSNYKTDQERFWAGEFGDDYTIRNSDPHIVSSNIALFSSILSRTTDVNSCLELGSNRGLNLVALGGGAPSDVNAGC